MNTRKFLATAAATCLLAGLAQADDSALTLGAMSYNSLCAVCHGERAMGGGEIADLFEVAPPKLTNLAARAGGQFPFADVYEVIVLGMDAPGHGDSSMPIWGDFFIADALKDRGVNTADAMYVAAGRAMALALYLETIQQ